jgi:Mce-associated membrane protein
MTTLRDNTDTDKRDEEIVGADAEEIAESDCAEQQSEAAEVGTRDKPRIAWSRVLGYGVLPGLALLLALAAGYVKWLDGSAEDSGPLRAETVRIASEDAVALLSYKAESADKDLGAARERLTGDFKNAYTALTSEVVIPGAKEKHISAIAKVAAAASVSATDSHAVVLAFVNQTVTIGEGAPTDTAPVVRVTLDKVNGRWLVSHFDPV